MEECAAYQALHCIVFSRTFLDYSLRLPNPCIAGNCGAAAAAAAAADNAAAAAAAAAPGAAAAAGMYVPAVLYTMQYDALRGRFDF